MIAALRTTQLHFFRWIVRRFARGLDVAVFEPAMTWTGRLRKWFMNLFADSGKIQSVLMGPLSFEIVRTGCNIGLFDLLDARPGLDVQTLSRKLGVATYPLEVILPGLVSLGLLHKVGPRYYNDPFLSQALLKGTNNDLLRKHFEYMHHIIAPAGGYIQDTVLENRPVGLHQLYGQTDDYYGAIARDAARRQYFYDFIGTYTQVNRDRVAGLPVFSEYSRVLDVGGNTGEMALAIARHHPTVKVTVFDFPEAVQIARGRFQDSGMGDRLSVIGGNLIQDDWPGGFDCLLFSHFMEMLSPEKYLEMLRKGFDLLPSGGAACVFTPVIADNEKGPLIYTIIGSYFMFLANGTGRLYSAEAITSWMYEAGFQSVQRHLLPIGEVVLIGRKP